jgi:hypothetical protein
MAWSAKQRTDEHGWVPTCSKTGRCFIKIFHGLKLCFQFWMDKASSAEHFCGKMGDVVFGAFEQG